MKFFLKRILEIFFPSHCIFCEKIVSKEALFCSDCWPKLQFITDPKCKICSYPFEFQTCYDAADLICSSCLIKKPSYDKSFTIFRYNYVLKKVVSNLKYRDQTFLAKKFAKILFDKVKNEITDCDFIVAAPLHIKRLKKRKFNQAGLLAKEISKISKKLKFIPDFLIRVKNTRPQVELRKKQREKNLKRAFLVNKKYRELAKGKKFLLIDDVMTTGATLENSAKELKRRGAREVLVLTIAKTVFNNLQ